MQRGILFVALVLFFGPLFASAQTSCLLFPSNSASVSGYGVSWDVFDSAKRLLVSTNCPADGRDVTLTVGRGDSTQYVWSTGYVYHEGEWLSKSLRGSGEAVNGWIIGSASANPFTPPATISAQNPLYFVGYVCTNRSSTWKCGCKDAACSQTFWQLQAYTGIQGGGGSGGGDSQPPSNYKKLIFGATPLDSDSSFSAFTSRVGMSERWGNSSGSTYPYELATIGGARAIKITAREGTKGANAGFIFNSIPGVSATGVNGGPHESFGRVKVWWPTGYDFNPVGPDGTSDPQYGGTKAVGFWGGGTPATADNANADGWALTIWTGSSFNYVTLGLDLNAPRDGSDGFALNEKYQYNGNLWRIDQNQGRWVQLEWEFDIEDSAGGMGRIRFWIDGKLGIDKAVRYFGAGDWTPQTGVKGIYLRNFYGGSGRAPMDQPIYYRDIELWGK